MQVKSSEKNQPASPVSPEPGTFDEAATAEKNQRVPGLYRVIRRNGELTGFDQNKIRSAITKAFLAVEGGTAAASPRLVEAIEAITNNVVDKLTWRKPDGGTFHIEEIQDQVELCLVRAGIYKVARAYMLYREEHTKIRTVGLATSTSPSLTVSAVGRPDKHPENCEVTMSIQRLRKVIAGACTEFNSIDFETLSDDVAKAYCGSGTR